MRLSREPGIETEIVDGVRRTTAAVLCNNALY